MSRSSGYTPREDLILCEAWLEISQDPIVGRNQHADKFWSRTVEKYNEALSEQGDGPLTWRALIGEDNCWRCAGEWRTTTWQKTGTKRTLTNSCEVVGESTIIENRHPPEIPHSPNLDNQDIRFLECAVDFVAKNCAKWTTHTQ
ncbi:hypothetical protein Scep_025789 [Stephania cephalantha]|uniref:Uncharacterized protein n=1 Tax=Stephania cephalantha TaxID=152367 RepID=A0AAP0HSS3_9MAGN